MDVGHSAARIGSPNKWSWNSALWWSLRWDPAKVVGGLFFGEQFLGVEMDLYILFFNMVPGKHARLGGGFKHFYVHPYLGKWSHLTNIFQLGWNHHLDYIVFLRQLDCWNFRGQRWWTLWTLNTGKLQNYLFLMQRLKTVNLIFLFGIFESFFWAKESMSLGLHVVFLLQFLVLFLKQPRQG